MAKKASAAPKAAPIATLTKEAVIETVVVVKNRTRASVPKSMLAAWQAKGWVIEDQPAPAQPATPA